MSRKPRILALMGSPRGEALIAHLLRVGAEGASAAGAEVTTVFLADLPLPVYDSDWEAEHGIPENARTLRTFVSENHGLLVATSELNGGYSTLLKNAIDWATRVDVFDESTGSVFAGRAAALISASTEPFGGMRSQVALQLALTGLGTMVIPTVFAMNSANKDGDVMAKAEQAVHRIGHSLAQVTAKLVPGGAATWI